MKTGKKISVGKSLVISISVIVILVASYFIFPSFKIGIDEAFDVLTSEDQDRIRKWVERFGMGGPLILILVMVAQMFLLVVPNILVMMIAIISYGPIWGSVISLAGVFASSSIGYLIGRKLGKSALDKIISKKLYDTLSSFIESYGAVAIGITRLASLCNDALGFAAGLLTMSYKKFIIATMSGITPLVVLLALYGRNGKIEKALIWIAGFTIVVLIIYIIIDKRRKRRKLAALTVTENP
jgi:uncharacterized membrane protein YdjX (TVP38/TMEM64 family)